MLSGHQGTHRRWRNLATLVSVVVPKYFTGKRTGSSSLIVVARSS